MLGTSNPAVKDIHGTQKPIHAKVCSSFLTFSTEDLVMNLLISLFSSFFFFVFLNSKISLVCCSATFKFSGYIANYNFWTSNENHWNQPDLIPFFKKKYRHSFAHRVSKTAHSMFYKVTNLENNYCERCPPSFVFTISPLYSFKKLI